ncbi:MAG: hypothetical protein LKJ88_04035 [Bacilli bacterium]|jgi:hypothetical protein|nr:hypothetical protein [Bacilli bacterium]
MTKNYNIPFKEEIISGGEEGHLFIQVAEINGEEAFRISLSSADYAFSACYPYLAKYFFENLFPWLEVKILSASLVFMLPLDKEFTSHAQKLETELENPKITAASFLLAKGQAEEDLQKEDPRLFKTSALLFPTKKNRLSGLEELKKADQTGLRRYISQRLTLNNVRWVGLGQGDSKLSFEDYLKNRKAGEEVKDIKEKEDNWGEPFKGRKEVFEENKTSSLTLGVNLGLRGELYQEYGDDLFPLLKLLELFSLGEASSFQKEAYKKGLKEGEEPFKLVQSGEAIFFMKTFYTSSPSSLAAIFDKRMREGFKASYLSFLLAKRLEKGQLQLLLSSKEKMIYQETLALENNLTLVKEEDLFFALKYSSLKKFLSHLRKCAYSIYIEGEKY